MAVASIVLRRRCTGEDATWRVPRRYAHYAEAGHYMQCGMGASATVPCQDRRMREILPQPSAAAAAFQAVLARPGGLDLFEAALTLDRIEDAALDLGAARAALDRLCAEVADELALDTDLDRIAALNRALFERR